MNLCFYLTLVFWVLASGVFGKPQHVEYMSVPHFLELLETAEYVERPLGLPETAHSQVNPAIIIDHENAEVLAEIVN
ncbi:unnamed protein product [Bursaphelenchus okinawaensis]|uniref:Uncharacterized protein n=1 Tax=Bursaphelenchus okinawaensis TaxID=465554 RepID=A0A811JQQ0_9BILA|nr:unnamed protein product [Bursaphelenchus okinawaensis]CAG9077649.1 unnamed protein product [Bursaphelenchus okinawaensis]